MKEWRDVLAVRLDNIGDVLMTGPALRSIKAAAPRARLTLLASESGANAAPLLPWVDQVIRARVVWQELGTPRPPNEHWLLVAELQRHCFDAAFVFTSFRQTPHPAAFLCQLAGIPVRVGQARERAAGVLTHAVAPCPDAVHQVDRNLHLLQAVDVPIVSDRLHIEIAHSHVATAAKLLARHALASDTAYVVAVPCTSAPARTYPLDRFAAAGRLLSDRTGLSMLVTGAVRERDRCAAVCDAIGARAINCAGATTLPELAALVAGARLVLTNNTSTMHLADATRTPVVVLFAGTELESQWRPRHTAACLLRRATACHPCYAIDCPFDRECLDIEPSVVANAAIDLLDSCAVGSTDRRSPIVS